MHKTVITFCSILILLWGCSKSNIPKSEYHYKLDLDKITGDELPVELNFRGNLTDTSYFYLPKIVPGIYDALDYGKFINNFKAIDKNGQDLRVNQVDTNCWEIIGTKNSATIKYTVNDGWENFDFQGIRPYRSSESHFDSSVVVLNANAVFGYFSQHQNLPFRVSMKKPESLYGAASLTKTRSAKKEDEYMAQNYRTLVDNPIMYAQPDTATIKLPNISVNVACYSNSKEKIAQELAQYIAPLVKNQTEYLGGKLATDKYTFLICHNQNLEDNRYFADGLEHNQSTLVLMYAPLDMAILKSNIFNLASHEFFHIQMPLGLHSHEIAKFDFNHPKFSKHLWLYEGTTEYFTIHMPIKQKMVTMEQFTHTIESKILGMKKFDTSVSFTELSKNVMRMPDEYMNVYAKGALINLCLDIELRKLSNGAYGVQNLVADLIKKYGKDKPFNDDDLFNDIYEITGYSEVKTFIEKYVEGTQALPLKEALQQVGLHLDVETGKISEITPMSANQIKLRKQWINQ
ncbi:peptidase M61 [Adhaeribacter swui]|uniref:Peptidase M61 n=1 Tax=Adhaeribacter swui TaxID=2086471 RepID=A0A7G7G871_9BACT|nr:peptidase M61 [Adhaeribacter swui]QNF33355.1 peptidase M61 [Adhaeribacter swui]